MTTPRDRSLNARIAAHWSWAGTADRTERTRPARLAYQAQLEREADPAGVMSPAQLASAVAAMRSAKARQMAKARWDKVKGRGSRSRSEPPPSEEG